MSKLITVCDLAITSVLAYLPDKILRKIDCLCEGTKSAFIHLDDELYPEGYIAYVYEDVEAFDVTLLEIDLPSIGLVINLEGDDVSDFLDKLSKSLIRWSY